MKCSGCIALCFNALCTVLQCTVHSSKCTVHSAQCIVYTTQNVVARSRVYIFLHTLANCLACSPFTVIFSNILLDLRWNDHHPPRIWAGRNGAHFFKLWLSNTSNFKFSFGVVGGRGGCKGQLMLYRGCLRCSRVINLVALFPINYPPAWTNTREPTDHPDQCRIAPICWATNLPLSNSVSRW